MDAHRSRDDKNNHVKRENGMDITIRKWCGSCALRSLKSDGTRMCMKTHEQVPREYCCRHWKMNDQLAVISKKVKK